MQATIEKTQDGSEELVVRVKIGKPRPSSNEKSGNMLLASETQKAAVDWNGHSVTVGLNAYYKPQK